MEVSRSWHPVGVQVRDFQEGASSIRPRIRARGEVEKEADLRGRIEGIYE